MKKIAVVTSTRAEFGLLMPVVQELRRYENEQFKVDLIVTGTHLDEAYGYTVDEIKNVNIRIDKMIKVSMKSNSALDISNNQVDVLRKFTEVFYEESYAGIVILGDRYEMLAVAIAAGNVHTPIFHLCGGDTTEGAIDEWIRHSITKMSYLHFVTNEESYNRVIQLGENPDRVFNYGSTSIDNILNVANMKKEDALKSLELSDCEYAICTYHPVTMKDVDVEYYINELVSAISKFPEIEFIMTKSNSDQGGERINELLDKAAMKIKNLHVYFSLGVVRYLSLMKHAQFVIGNSSSGIIETPAFGIPTINIGDRQKGRLQSNSILNCDSDEMSIVDAINKAQEKNFKEFCKTVESPYGDGHAASKIAEKIAETVLNDKIDLMKQFYDIKK